MIQWQLLENDLKKYFGKNDAKRTPEIIALEIEKIYINAVSNKGNDMFGNRVLSLNRYTLAASLRSAFKSVMNVKIPKATPPEPNIPKIDIPDINLDLLKIPNMKIPNVDIPGLPSIDLSDINLPSANLPSINLPGVNSTNIGLSNINLSDIPDINIPKIDVDITMFFPIKLNLKGLLGLQYLWSGVLLSTDIPPPGSVKVISNTVTNPGILSKMDVSEKNSLVSELMKAFKNHSKTVSGVCTSLVYVGTNLIPIQFPWIGIQ